MADAVRIAAIVEAAAEPVERAGRAGDLGRIGAPASELVLSSEKIASTRRPSTGDNPGSGG